jgi:hypothetical protein
MTTADTFSTIDLYTSAFLVVSGYPVRKTTRDEAGRIVLHFDPTAANAVIDFECGAPVDARLYATAHRALKMRVVRALQP